MDYITEIAAHQCTQTPRRMAAELEQEFRLLGTQGLHALEPRALNPTTPLGGI